MSEHDGQASSAAEFLAGLASRLRASDGVDGELAAILEANLLITDPDDKAVAKAKEEVLKLASTRASASIDD